MVKVNYLGFRDKEAARKAFLELKPFRDHIIRLSCNFFPFRPDHKALHAIVVEIDTAARHFGLDPHEMYASRDSAGVGGAR